MVVDAIHGEMYARLQSVHDSCPEAMKAAVLEKQMSFMEKHRRLSLQLYQKHMSMVQLQDLFNFQNSESGIAIRQAQTRIDQELKAGIMEQEYGKAGSPRVVIRTINSWEG